MAQPSGSADLKPMVALEQGQNRYLHGPYNEHAGGNNVQEQLLYEKIPVLPKWASIKEVLASLYI